MSLFELMDCRSSNNKDAFYFLIRNFVMAVRGRMGQDTMAFSKPRSFDKRKITVSTEAFTLFLLEDRWDEWDYKWRKENDGLTEDEKREDYLPPKPRYTESAQARADRLGTSKKAKDIARVNGAAAPSAVVDSGKNSEYLSEAGLIRLGELQQEVAQLRKTKEAGEEMEADFHERLKAANTKRGKRKADSAEEADAMLERSKKLKDLYQPSEEEEKEMNGVFAGFDWSAVEEAPGVRE